MLLEPLDPNERFRSRRQQARRRRAIRRVATLSVVALAAAGATLGARFLGERETASPTARNDPVERAAAPAKPQPRAYPDEMRGIHVTMALASLEGELDEYLSLTRDGLNTLELDVKDENGEVAFRRPRVRLAREIGAAHRYYDPFDVVAAVREKGVYLIGRVVVFEDPLLARERPAMAIRRQDGGVWVNSAGLGWSNPYDERVWEYNVDVAEAAARAGFDEIQFDYVRFPTDGDLSSAVFRGARGSKAKTIARFLAYASERLKPLGVRISADVFGLSATRDMGIGQRISRMAEHLDAIYPMVYPSHYASGEFDLPDPNGQPGRTVALSLRDFARELRGHDTRLIPWLQDFSLGREYTLDDVRDQILAARDAGAEGFLLWNPSGVYTAKALAAP